MGLEDVHQAYTTMAASGILTEAQRNIFDTVSQRLLIEQGAEAIMLGVTDLALAFDEATARFPIIDCAGIHVSSITKLALP
jgi:aspartate racemase